MQLTNKQKISVLEESDKILAGAIIEQQKSGQISPDTMELLQLIRGKE